MCITLRIHSVGSGGSTVLRKQLAPFSPYATAVLRVVVGAVFLFMGLPKIENPSNFLGLVSRLGFPAAGVIGWIPVILEPVGGILLILGLFTPWLALYFSVEMLITTVVVKAAHGTPFIVTGRPGVGFELDLLLLAAALVLVVFGSGTISIDRNVLKREY